MPRSRWVWLLTLNALGCAASPNVEFGRKRMELIAETSLLATTFEHGDARFYERSGQAGVSFTPYLAQETEGAVGSPTLELGGIVGEHGDAERCCAHGQVGTSYRVRVPVSDFVRPVVGPRAGLVFGETPEGDPPITPYAGAQVSAALLGGLAAIDVRVDAVFALGERGFSYRDGRQDVIPRGQLGVSTDLCAIFGSEACHHPKPETRLMDLRAMFENRAYEVAEALPLVERAKLCRALGKALARDPWDSPRKRVTIASCPAPHERCTRGDFDPEPTPMQRFLAELARQAPEEARGVVEQLIAHDDRLTGCLERELLRERDARRAGKLPDRHAIYGVYPSELAARFGCDGAYGASGKPTAPESMPHPVDEAICLARR